MSASITQEMVKDFVIAGHGNLPKVKEMLDQDPELLNMQYAWSETDSETAIQGAAQVGSVSVAEFLVSRGAPLSICTAAMLGREEVVQSLLKENPGRIREAGAHGIPLLTHAALSGNVRLVGMLYLAGATTGASSALLNSVSRGRKEVTLWLLDNASPDLFAKNFQGKTALQIANEMKDAETAEMLRKRGAQ